MIDLALLVIISLTQISRKTSTSFSKKNALLEEDEFPPYWSLQYCYLEALIILVGPRNREVNFQKQLYVWQLYTYILLHQGESNFFQGYHIGSMFCIFLPGCYDSRAIKNSRLSKNSIWSNNAPKCNTTFDSIFYEKIINTIMYNF